jgi:hypothetical protein
VRLAAGCAICLLFAGCGPPVRSLIYPVPPVTVPSPPPEPLREVRLESRGDRVVAWLSEAAARAAGPAAVSGERPLVLYFHGNGENLETMRQSGLFAEFAGLDVDLLAVDYPGYGRSAGSPSEAANLAAAEAALDWAKRERGAQRRIAAGWSLGAAVAVQLAARHPADFDRLVLMSPWTGLRTLARRHYPGFMVAALLQEDYDSLAAAAAVRSPALVIHGSDDSIIPAEQGEAMAGALGAGARFVAIAGAGHNDLLGQARVWEELRAFVR